MIVRRYWLTDSASGGCSRFKDRTKAYMKKAIKEILGTKNARIIALIRKAARISTFKFFRAMSGEKENLPALQTRTFKLLDAHVFFGYYDVPQFGCDENRLLATVAPLINTTPTPSHNLKLGFYDLRESRPKFKEFASTTTWCWQQGCRLQWYTHSNKNTAIYNDLIGGRYGCIIRDVHSGKIITSFSRPIYTVSRDGKWGLSLDFSRLQRLRPGYGYNTLRDISVDEMVPSGDGIWRIDMKTGEEKLLFSVRDIAELQPDKTAAAGQHYFNHLLFNKDGNHFMFFHIRQLANELRKIRLLTSSINGDNIRLLNDSGHASHYCWKDNSHLLCYSTVVGNGEGYYLYDIRSGESKVVAAGILSEDGHPSYLPNGRGLITDTYPDKYGEQSLFLYNCETKNLIILDKEFSPVRFNAETRCDFHPRVSPSGRYVCIDCIVDGKRAMRLFDISTPSENSIF